MTAGALVFAGICVVSLAGLVWWVWLIVQSERAARAQEAQRRRGF